MKNESGRKGIMIYYEMLEQFELLSNEELGELIFAIMRYSKDGTEPKIESPAAKILFSFMKCPTLRDPPPTPRRGVSGG